MTRYPSRKTWWLGLIIFGISVVIMLPLLWQEAMGISDVWLYLLINVVVIGFLIWMWFDTYYTLSPSVLGFRSGPWRGKIAVSTIREVKKRNYMWAGYRPALATKGIVIRYDHYNEIYLSPKHQEEFVKQLTTYNPSIKVIQE